MRKAVLFLGVAVNLFLGCAVPPPVFAPTSSNPSRLTAQVAAGRSVELAPGHPLGFWIWHDDDGLWHVRTTAKRRDHRFQGVIRPLDGAQIVDLRTVSIDSKDRIGMVGGRYRSTLSRAANSTDLISA